MTDILPDEIVVRGRDEFVTSMRSAYLLKRPNDDVSSGTVQLAIFAAVSDVLVGQSLNARTIGREIPDSQLSGIRVDQRLAQLRLPARRAETGASGFVVIATSGGGGDVTQNQTLDDENSGATFYATAASATYQDGDPVAISGLTTGPATNLAAGTVLKWSSPGTGVSVNATVQEPGLTGGRYAETDEQAKQRIADARSDPAASANSAHYIALAERSGQHGVPVGKGFAYPSCCGTGTIGLAFLLTPSGPGVSRIPTSAQIGIVRAYVLTVPDDPTRIPPGDDLLLDTTIVAQPVTIVVDVRWSQAAAGWRDSSRWPIRRAAGEGAIVVSAAADATHFTVARDSGSYVGEPQPAIGQTVCVYDVSTGTFARKRILSFTGSGPWVITVDTSNDSSDTAFVPVVGQRVSPWSKSLDDVAKPIVDYFDTLGPGEQVDPALVFDPGARQKRSPASPETYPDLVTNHVVADILDVTAVNNAIVQEGLGEQATVGTPGAVAYLLELGDIAIFPLT